MALCGPSPLSVTLTSSELASMDRTTPTLSDSSSLLPCSMALMQASATAVLRSSTRSSLKPISRATLAAVFIATFSYPSREGSRSSMLLLVALSRLLIALSINLILPPSAASAPSRSCRPIAPGLRSYREWTRPNRGSARARLPGNQGKSRSRRSSPNSSSPAVGVAAKHLCHPSV